MAVSKVDGQFIAEAIKYYIENLDSIRKQGEQAYQIAQDFFPEKVFRDLASIYDSFINESN